ncbi:MAG: hypothetical protein LUG61_04880 [Lachnospiraceae bacterium]|nr:hypothetical protein [Lachnospiraceae bacterium]
MKREYEERLSKEAQLLDEYLTQYRICAIRKRSLERRRREILKEFGYPLSTVTYDGMPHGSSSGAGCEALPLKLAEIDEKINQQISENTKILLQTIDIINLLPENSMDRVILEYRYIDCYGWRRICEAVPIGKTPAVRRWRRGLHTLIQKKIVREIIAEYSKQLEDKENL